MSEPGLNPNPQLFDNYLVETRVGAGDKDGGVKTKPLRLKPPLPEPVTVI